MDLSVLAKMNILRKTERPNSLAYIEHIFDEFIGFCGDRLYGDDPSVVGGIAILGTLPVTVIAQLRGNNIEEQIKYHFSMTYPEGYRKALRIMRQAEKFKRPIICFIDTVGAYPGREAEERGQASAIANNLMEMMNFKVPIISILIGYGGSGGALALCVADRIVILENAMLSVISPKACAEVLWKDSSRMNEAIEMLKMTSNDLLEQGIVDYIIPEPNGGAQNDVKEMSERIKNYLIVELHNLKSKHPSKLVKARKGKFRKI